MRQRFVRMVSLGVTLAIITIAGPSPAHAGLFFIDEAGISPFGPNDNPTLGGVVLVDGQAKADHSGVLTGTESDILVFKANRQIVYQSDSTLLETETLTPPADTSSFTVERPTNLYFITEADPNSSGFERTTYRPDVGNPGYFIGSDRQPAFYDIVSDSPFVVPEPSSLVTGLTACLVALGYARRRRHRTSTG